MKPSVLFASMLRMLREGAGGREGGLKSFHLLTKKGGVWGGCDHCLGLVSSYLARQKVSGRKTFSKTAFACSGTKKIESPRKYL